MLTEFCSTGAPAPVSRSTPAAPVIQTLDRGLEVLRAFRAERTPMTNAELVRRTGLPKATVSRMTTTLVALGFLRRVGGGPRFALATGAHRIGQTYIESSPVARCVTPFMQALADRLRVSVSLAIPDRLDMLYVAQCTSARIATLRIGVGSLLPMGWTASGRAWLSGLQAEVQARYIASLRQSAGPRADNMEQGIRAAFDELKATGVCTSFGNFQRGAFGIAIPVTVGRSDTLMALACGAVDPQADTAAIASRIAPELVAASKALVDLLRDVDAQP
ncbi:Pca regulon regulatory protein [Cupriavidus numazuensis]|uniref:Pca regulon regulatory protein n=1 Tax=Cupriavidus numazuensis TaxID=221992 RepID=A0ABN7Q5L2_9BURK|nr:Pca regulon regulatory protein [Cupriavidus numazuensis]